jgi:YVTN family beta-propeller protein
MRSWGHRWAALRALLVVGLMTVAMLAGFSPAASASGYSLVATINVGSSSQPYFDAYDSANGLVYVSEQANDALAVIDPASNTVVATIPLYSDPATVNGDPTIAGLAVDPALGRVYVSESFSDDVAVIDTATDTVTTRIAVGSNPGEIAVDTSTNMAYVANVFGGSVSEIDLSTDSVTRTVTVGYGDTYPFTYPWSIAVDPSTGGVFVLTEDNGQIYSISGGAATLLATLSSSVQGALDYVPLVDDPSTETLYALDQAGYLYAISESSGAVSVVTSMGCSGAGPAVDPVAGLLYVPCTNYYVDVVDLASGSVVANVMVGPSYADGGDLATEWVALDSADGAAYVPTYYQGTVVVVNGSGGSGSGGSTGSSPGVIDVSSGTLSFVSAPGNLAFPPVTLDGRDQSVSASLGIDLGDNTGLGAGWQLDATGTELSDASHSLPADAVSVDAKPTVGCDTGAECTLAADTVSYPYVLPTGTSPPVATALFSAAAGTGMGDQTVTPSFSLDVPANAAAGAYSATWTFSLVSGP